MQTKVKCHNCGHLCTINELVKWCPKCGKIFTKFINTFSEEKIKSRAIIHRSGDGVDKLDG